MLVRFQSALPIERNKMKNPAEIRQIALDGLVMGKALDSIGLYPKSIVGGENAYEERNEYQNGWNEALISYTESMSALTGFINSLDEKNKQAIETMMFSDAFMLNLHDNKVNMWLCVNDVFYPAADAEDISLEDLPVLAELYEQYDYPGIVAWVAKKRNIEPIKDKRKYLDMNAYSNAIKRLEE